MNTTLNNISLSQEVRYGRCGTPANILMRYFKYCDDQSEGLTREQVRRIYISAFNVILETVCDDLIARCWRGWCLDNIGKPLKMLKEHSVTDIECDELKSLEAQMRLLSRYFLN